ncbi:SNF2 family N-terminal domain-domain-containing protein, partial [Naematelia encephala]
MYTEGAPKRRLADFRTALPSPRNTDGVPGSCSEESDDDEPRPLTQAPLRPHDLNGESSHQVSTSVGRGGKIVYNVSRATGQAKYYVVQWRKPQQKKVKTWDGDAYLKVEGAGPGAKMVMYSEEGNIMATSRLAGLLPVEGCEMRIGPFDTECDREILENEFKASTAILNRPQSSRTSVPAPIYRPPTFVKAFKAPSQTHAPHSYAKDPVEDVLLRPTHIDRRTTTRDPGSSVGRTVAQSSFYAPKVKPIVIGETRTEEQRQKWGGALHDPEAEGAVIMQRPPEKHAMMMKTELRDVVLDPLLSEKMRDHQKEGVKFMYSCVMGLTSAEGQGCILADEMGLGKTMQTIALIWTLLRQCPFTNQRAVIGKALVVCPVTLVANWQKEFRKWLGPRRDLQVLAANATDDKVHAFTHNPSAQVLIIGYERLRKVAKSLASCQPPIDLIICDEGHRLKSNKKDNKTTRMFDALRTQRRIILSGTPVQNELSEYWAMVDFCCPGILGSYNNFNKHYEKPIMKSRSPGCSTEAREEGQAKAEELSRLSKEFVLRRTAAVLDNYLPPKHEYVVFVAPSALQIKILHELLKRGTALEVSEQKFAFGLIDFMRKISNSPMLIRMKTGADEPNDATALEKAKAIIPRDLNINDVTTSGKMFVLDRMVHTFWTTTKEKVVIVSNWTSTLDMIQNLCKLRKWPFLRLDGSTSTKQRQPFVDQFNRELRDQSFVFLLSAKAGGTGLNLIGASRLILFDSDWNPSTDLQAMARIHRDGQKHPVYIYRLLTTNTIDEKIYQRQIYKTALSDQMMDQEKRLPETKDSFTRAELQDIFTLNLRTDGCQTHDLLGCE